ncbi:MAG TPA: TolC family protein [Albitalea sp.]
MAIDRWTRSLLLAAAFGATVALAQAQPATLGTNLQGLLEHARANHPELASMRLEADAAAQRVQPAGALPDPMFRIELNNFTNTGNPAGPNLLPSRVGETMYTLIQPLPGWGKRALRQEAATADAAQADARAKAVWTELAMRIKTAYAQYHYVAGNERLTAEVLDLMTRLEKIAQARYAGGLVEQQDAVRAQLEQTAMRSELIMLDSEKQQLRARLNALLARESGAPLAEPLAPRPLPSPAALEAATLAARARSGNPSLLAEEARLLAAMKSRDLTLRNRYPDFQVGLAPTQMGSRITAWQLMFEMNIPLQQSTRRSEEREAEAMVGAARARAEMVANQLRGELAESLAGLEAARRTESLVSAQLLPQSELGLRSALASYENGKVDFATLLDAQRLIRKAQQDRLKAQAEAQMRLAEIERIVGEDL